jgi:serine protease
MKFTKTLQKAIQLVRVRTVVRSLAVLPFLIFGSPSLAEANDSPSVLSNRLVAPDVARISLAAKTPQLIPRIAPQKPVQTILAQTDSRDQVILKFREGTGVQFQANTFVAEPNIDLTDLEGIMSAYFSTSTPAIERLFSRPDSELKKERELGQRRSGRKLADLTLYYKINIPSGVDSGVFCDMLNALPYVELATPAPKPAPLPGDIAPETSDFSGSQGYLLDPPSGIGVVDPALVPGGDGAQTKVVDIEYSWVLDHEDLELIPVNIDSATPHDPFPADEGNHGTAVLGMLGASANHYGVTGLVPATTLQVAPANTEEHNYSLERAINLATSVLEPGDAILLEQQMCVCGNPCDASARQEGLGPVEWHQPVYDAIVTATARGIVVVEPAGNGNVNLDSASCKGRFDRNARDSGAIIVGAGNSQTHQRLEFSSYGSRVDLQGWGQNVTTTGYGNLFDPEDIRQRYTSQFGGSSSASPIVTGAVLAVQGAVMASGKAPLKPETMRQLLLQTGTPQDSGDTTHIGPLPNVLEAVKRALLGGTDLDKQASQDMSDRAAQDGRFGTAFTGTFEVNRDWKPDWELRWMDFSFSAGRSVRMYHATSKSDASVRSTNFFDPDTGKWASWEQAS